MPDANAVVTPATAVPVATKAVPAIVAPVEITEPMVLLNDDAELSAFFKPSSYPDESNPNVANNSNTFIILSSEANQICV